MSDGPRGPGPGGDGRVPPGTWEDEARAGHSDPTVRIDRSGQGDVDAEGRYDEEVTAYRGPGAARPRGPEPEAEEGGNRWLAPVLAAVGALLVGLLLGWLVWSGGDGDRELAAQVDQLSEQNTQLQGQVDDLTAQLGELEAGGGGPTVEELTAENEQLTADVEEQRAEVERLTGENSDLTDQVSSLEEDNAQLQERIEQILDDVDAALVAAPDLVGGTADDAATQAEENGWVLVQIPTASDTSDPGTVLSQAPPAGTPMLSGSALAIGVATAPDAPPPSDAGTVFESTGTGPGTLDTFVLEGGTRHAVIYSFTGEGRHTVSVVDADGATVVRLVDVNGTKEGATHIPLTGTYALEVDVDDDVEWELRVVALP